MTGGDVAKEERSVGSNSKVLSGICIARISTVPFFVLSQLKHQIEAVVSSGAQVMVVTSSGIELNALRELSGVACEPIEISRAVSPWRDLLALVQLFRLFRRHQVDIAHSTTPKAGLLTAIAGLLAGVPIRIHTFTGQPWVSMAGPMRQIARWSDWLIGKLNTRCYADSDSQRRFLLEQNVISPQKLQVIGAGSLAGVDLNRFNPARFSGHEKTAMKKGLGIPLEAPVLLFVGRITADKGVRELIAAFRKLKASGSLAHLVLVGPFDSERGGGGEINRRDFDSTQGTHMVGYTEYPEAYMAIADILCLPSYREGFGTVVIEAAAMNVPTVGTDIYGLSDAVINGETGILVPPRDAAALEAALSTLLADEVQRARMGIAARRRIEVFFDAAHVNSKVVEEYRSLLDGRHNQ